MPRQISFGYIWIPPENHPNWKITVTRKDGTVDDVTEYIYSASVTLGATEVIGDFTIEIDNLDGTFSDVYSGGEIVQVYLDYNDASTRIMKGIVDKVGYTKSPEFKVVLKGRPYAQKLMAITVTKQYSNTETSEILKDLFDTYAPEFTYNHVNASSTTVTVSWYQKPFWECVIDLCNAAGFDCYIDDDNDCHYFEEKSIKNTTDAIVHDDNLVEVCEFGKDTIDVRNRIIVYGKDIEGLPLIATAEDTNSQSNLFVKEQIITDNNITTMAEAQQRANEELNRLKNSVDRGEVTAYPGLPTLRPGETIFISDPENDLWSYYKVIQFTHRFSSDGVETTVTIERSSPSVAKLIKERILSEQRLSDITNPYELRYSWNFTFDDDSQVASHSGTETVNGKLKLASGYAEGTMVTVTRDAGFDVTKAQLKINGEQLTGSEEYWLSNNGGLNWFNITPDELYTFVTIGSKLKIKVKLVSSNTQIESMALLYR